MLKIEVKNEWWQETLPSPPPLYSEIWKLKNQRINKN